MTSASPQAIPSKQYLDVPESKYRIARWVGQIESLLCICFSSLLFIGGAMACVASVAETIGDWSTVPKPQIAATIICVYCWMMLDLPTAFGGIVTLLRHEHPVALKIATRRKMLRPIFRPFAALWWIAHFLITAWLAALLHALIHHDKAHHLELLIFAIGFSMSGNAFLMLSVCAATSSPRIRAVVWRFRILIDIAIALFGTFFIDRIIAA